VKICVCFVFDLSMWKAHWSTAVVFNSAIQINCHCHFDTAEVLHS